MSADFWFHYIVELGSSLEITFSHLIAYHIWLPNLRNLFRYLLSRFRRWNAQAFRTVLTANGAASSSKVRVGSPELSLALDVTALHNVEGCTCRRPGNWFAIGHAMVYLLFYLMKFSRTAILRHRASDYDLEMKNDGFVLVADLLKVNKKTAAGIALSSHSEEDVRKVTFFFSHVHIHRRLSYCML